MLDQAFAELKTYVDDAIYTIQWSSPEGSHECVRRASVKIRRTLKKIDGLLERAADK